MTDERAERSGSGRFLKLYGFAGGVACGFAAGLVVGWQLALWFAWAGATTLYLKERRRRAHGDAPPEAETTSLWQEKERLAMFDRRTGLLNRRGLAAAFQECQRLLVERDLVITMLMIEFERLRQVEELEGRNSAEALAGGFAELLRQELGDGDRAGRLEDGRFLLMLCAPRYERPGEDLGRRVQESAAAERDLHRLGRPLSLSIGVARIPRAETEFSEALVEAEQALRAATHEGPGRIVAYRPAMGRERARRNGILREVAEALEADRFVPVYQPIVAIEGRRIVAFEALARLRRPDGTLVEAAHLRPAFEDPCFSTDISERILARAITDAGQLRRTGLDFGRVAVNVTERQLADPEFAERVLDLLLVEGLSPQDLMLEIAEQVLLSRRERLILGTLRDLADAGVELAFDDFGTGYAALSSLRTYPVGRIKLERSFVADIAHDDAAREISAAVLNMARGLDRDVVAEGVETAEVHDVLEQLGCDHVQGFYYSPPVPFAEVERLARRGIAA